MKICWTAAHVATTMDPDALQTSDARFMATHHPVTMVRKDHLDAGGTTLDQDAFLQAFLEARDFAFVPVLGFAGTGKSHLIRWMKARIPASDRRMVLFIPKIRTNLRDVLSLILDAQTDPRYDIYRQRLSQATQGLTIEQAREKLINRIGENIDIKMHPDIEAGSDEYFLATALPALFYDAYFREKLNCEGGIIHQLALHVIGQQDGVERLDSRRQFKPADIPSDLKDFKRAGEKAREIYIALGSSPELMDLAVAWINRNLDAAIAEIIDFGGDSLLRLMREVREDLAVTDTELVFLIEDFAKLQGIDRSLLEALLARVEQPDQKSLCRIRIALACTGGYFKNLPETVIQRATFTVWLDYGKVGDGVMTTDRLHLFAARYLNAARASDAELNAWSRQQEREGAPPPNPCHACKYRATCHASFGSVEGIGLYPFTVTALEQMQQRIHDGIFNSRHFLKDVLRPVLDRAEHEIPAGHFPSGALHAHFGKKVNPTVEVRLRGDVHLSRRLPLIDLWGPTNRPVDFPSGLHDAFRLPAFGGLEVWDPGTVEPAPTPPAPDDSGEPDVPPLPVPPEPTPGPPVTSPGSHYPLADLEAIDRWVNNRTPLAQTLVNKLRDLVFRALDDRIDWDREHLVRSRFLSADGTTPLKRAQIFFETPGAPRQRLGDIHLSIPLQTEDLVPAAVALKGLLMFEASQSWQFPEGLLHLRTLANQLDRWSEDVVRQIRDLGGPGYDPVPATVELLALGARLRGIAIPSDDPVPALMAAMFHDLGRERTRQPIPGAGAVSRGTSSVWTHLRDRFEAAEPELHAILLARAGCSKNGAPNIQVLDAHRIVPVLERFSQDWTFRAPLPSRPAQELKALVDVYQEFKSQWQSALDQEHARLSSWVDEMIVNFGPEPDARTAAETIKQTALNAVEAGCFKGYPLKDLESVCDRFADVPLTDALRSVGAVGTTPKVGDLLELLASPSLHSAVERTRGFLEVANRFLEATEKGLDLELENLRGGGSQQAVWLRDIEADVQALMALISKIGGLDDPA